MPNKIRILHLTDTHIRSDKVPDIDRRIEALIALIKKEDREIDVVVFTGDLAFSGKTSEYELFDKHVFKKIRTHLKIPSSHFLIVPGNHDVNRDEVTVPELNKNRKLSNPREAQCLIENTTDLWKRQKPYFEYAQTLAPPVEADTSRSKYFHNKIYSTRKLLNVKGMILGFGLFNSSWLCANDEDYENLFLTEKQISDASDSLGQCDIKIALVHHPFDWLHPKDRELTENDLKRNFPLILTGHLHRPITASTADTNAESINLTARAFFGGHTGAEVEDGIQTYEIDLENKSINILFDKFIRKRNVFDKDTDHADDGKISFPISLPTTISSSTGIIVQKLISDGSLISEEIKSTLSRLQGLDEPIFVTPKIEQFIFKGSGRRVVNNDVQISQLQGKNAIFTGGSDSGKTILLKKLAAEGGLQASSGNRKEATVFFQASDLLGVTTIDDLLAQIEKKADCDRGDLGELFLTVIVDRFPESETEMILLLQELCDQKSWSYFVGCASFASDVLVQKEELSSALFLEIQPWGPSRIREFSLKMFSGTSINPIDAYNFVTTCLKLVDLPTTPTVVSLYLSVFSNIDGSISSISFLRLLEKIEFIRLGVDEHGSHSLYNRKKILSILAVKCLQDSSISVSVEYLEAVVSEFFSEKRLEIDVKLFCHELIDAGVLSSDGSNVSFSNYVFFDYFLAVAFNDDVLKPKDYTGDILTCSRVASALSLFAGLKRENVSLAQSFMDTIEKYCKASGELDLKDLDVHIKSLLVPENRLVSEVDEVAAEAVESVEDLEVEDSRYRQQRDQIQESREELLKQDLGESVDDLSLQIDALNSFYTIFKNLENISNSDKVSFIDRILDYHITTNFFLIDFYFTHSKNESFRTCAAYMLTVTGHSFMASAMGNPNLCSTIREVFDETKNDFKKLLLLLLLSEFGYEESPKLILDFVDETESRAATEIIFVHLRKRLVKYEKRTLPAHLLSVFKSVFLMRQKRYGPKIKAGDVTPKAKYDELLKSLKLEHSQYFQGEDSMRNVTDPPEKR